MLEASSDLWQFIGIGIALVVVSIKFRNVSI